MTDRFIQSLDYSKGLIPVIVQETAGDVLMLGYANEAAVQATLRSGYATFWSRSRNELWEKGATSGNRLAVQEIRTDCDRDTLLYIVQLEGEGACHVKNPDGTAKRSCFFSPTP